MNVSPGFTPLIFYLCFWSLPTTTSVAAKCSAVHHVESNCFLPPSRWSKVVFCSFYTGNSSLLLTKIERWIKVRGAADSDNILTIFSHRHSCHLIHSLKKILIVRLLENKTRDIFLFIPCIFLFSLSKPGSYITHNATWHLTVVGRS